MDLGGGGRAREKEGKNRPGGRVEGEGRRRKEGRVREKFTFICIQQ